MNEFNYLSKQELTCQTISTKSYLGILVNRQDEMYAKIYDKNVLTSEEQNVIRTLYAGDVWNQVLFCSKAEYLDMTRPFDNGDGQ